MGKFFSSQLAAAGVGNEKARELGPETIGPNSVSFLTIEDANKLNHGRLFDTLVSRQDDWDFIDSLPLIDKSIATVMVPYSYDLHHEVSCQHWNLEEGITSFINNSFGSQKYLLSCDPRIFFAIRLQRFSYDHVDLAVESGGFNSHFILFDAKFEMWVVFYSRFPFITISWKNGIDMINDDSKENWRAYYEENIEAAARGQSSDFVDFVNKTYIPRISGFREIGKI